MNKTPANIVLIGMPGAGKSTVGVVLAKIMNKAFTDTDLVIQKKYDETLQNLIDTFGAEGFIKLENEVLRELEAHDSIIATGGSAVYSEEGMRHLRDIGRIVYLKGSVEEIESRIEDFDERGIVMRESSGGGLEGLMREREPLYELYSDIVVDIDGKTVTETARCIIANLES